MSLAVAGRKRQTVCRLELHIIWQSVPENGDCDRERATAGC